MSACGCNLATRLMLPHFADLYRRWRQGCPYPGIRLELGVDPLPTPSGSWLFVERRGVEFFPVVPSSSGQRGGLQAASQSDEDYINGPYQFCIVRPEKKQQQAQQQGGAAAGADGATEPVSPGGQPIDPTLQQQQQQQAPSPGFATPRGPPRPRAKRRALDSPGSHARSGSAQLTPQSRCGHVLLLFKYVHMQSC